MKGFYNPPPPTPPPKKKLLPIYLLLYLICIQTTHSEVNNNMSLYMVIECINLDINGKRKIAGRYTIMQFNCRHFKMFQLEKLALFNLAYFCHPPIKPKFPSRQNYPIYGIPNCSSIH